MDGSGGLTFPVTKGSSDPGLKMRRKCSLIQGNSKEQAPARHNQKFSIKASLCLLRFPETSRQLGGAKFAQECQLEM